MASLFGFWGPAAPKDPMEHAKEMLVIMYSSAEGASHEMAARQNEVRLILGSLPVSTEKGAPSVLQACCVSIDVSSEHFNKARDSLLKAHPSLAGMYPLLFIIDREAQEPPDSDDEDLAPDGELSRWTPRQPMTLLGSRPLFPIAGPGAVTNHAAELRRLAERDEQALLDVLAPVLGIDHPSNWATDTEDGVTWHVNRARYRHGKKDDPAVTASGRPIPAGHGSRNRRLSAPPADGEQLWALVTTPSGARVFENRVTREVAAENPDKDAVIGPPPEPSTCRVM